MLAMQKPHEIHGRRRSRNWAVFAGLMALVLLLFAVTIVRLGPNARNPSSVGNWGETLAGWLSE